jgi:hypothetical protein
VLLKLHLQFVANVDTKMLGSEYVQCNHNPKVNYKIKCLATWTQTNAKVESGAADEWASPADRSDPPWVLFEIQISSLNKCIHIRWMDQSPVKISEFSKINGKIHSQNQCPCWVHGIIHSGSQTYMESWKHQRYDQVRRSSKYPLMTGPTRVHT